MRRRLTDEEREIRSGRGIPLSRFWAFPFIVVMLMIAAMDSSNFERCVGDPLELPGKAGAAVRMAAAIPCHVFLIGGSWIDWLLVAAIWVSVPFALLNRGWSVRHKAYWDKVRQREKELRAEKRAARERAKEQELP